MIYSELVLYMLRSLRYTIDDFMDLVCIFALENLSHFAESNRFTFLVDLAILKYNHVFLRAWLFTKVFLLLSRTMLLQVFAHERYSLLLFVDTMYLLTLNTENFRQAHVSSQTNCNTSLSKQTLVSIRSLNLQHC